jgi:hypothetical protein
MSASHKSNALLLITILHRDVAISRLCSYGHNIIVLIVLIILL